MKARAALCLSALAAALGTSCADSQGGRRDAPAEPDPLASLRAFESARRAQADFARAPTWDRATGPNPFALARLPGSSRFVGLLRGRDALVVLDASLHEVARLPAPASPTGLAMAADGALFVSGEGSGSIARYRTRGGVVEPAGTFDVPSALVLRSLAWGPEGVLYAADARDGRVFTIDLTQGKEQPQAESDFRCNEPVALVRAGSYLAVDCLLDHAIVIRRVDGRGRPIAGSESVIRHDGPLFSMDAEPVAGGLLVAAGGVEDHPLDRTEGSFGFIDSYAFVYRVADGKAPERVRETNVSELGVVTPKWIDLSLDASGAARVTIGGYGGEAMAELRYPADLATPPEVKTRALPPGTTAFAAMEGGGLALADPLLDAWIALEAGPPSIVPVSDAGAPPRSVESKVGEALVFTTLMAPWNRSEGRLSRFTCETCHFEASVDGRTHSTGRGDVRATTKPLLGLFNNRPHFSRALDPDLSSVADNEFRVAGAKSDHDPSFALDVASRPWLAALGAEGELGPEALRRSFMTFLMDLAHRPNPKVRGRTALDAEERRGAEVFERRCERCHAARLASDEPAARVPFGEWERLVTAPEGAIVWGANDYAKTGVEPYVHELGARVPSLRRLYLKRPYFTNGSASDLAAVLERVRYREGELLHDGAQADAAWERLTEEEQQALLAFLDVL